MAGLDPDVGLPGLTGMFGQGAENVLDALVKAQLFIPQVKRAQSEAEQARIQQALKEWELKLNLQSGRVYPTGFGNAIIQKIDPQTGEVKFEFIGKGGQGQRQPSELSELERLSQTYSPEEYERIVSQRFGPRETWEDKAGQMEELADIKADIAR